MSEVTFYIKIFIALMVLVNPIEGIPIFLTGTSNLTREQRIAVAKKASVSVFIILTVSLFLGQYLLKLFGIGIPSFSVAGGIIIFLISVNMVIGKTSSGEKSISGDPDQDQGDIAVVPLATPLLAGPGPISSIIVYGSRSPGIIGDVLLCVIVACVAVAVWLSLNAASKVGKALNETGIKVLTKISGLLVAAIAVELIFSGLTEMLSTVSK